jgi:hypothetical protein
MAPAAQDRIRAGVAARRLQAQQIARPTLADPAEVVAWLGAVQAQDFLGSLWAVGLRLAGRDVTEASVERAIADGTVLRLHAMRGTWQLVTPADARWIVGLVGPGLIARFTRRYAELGLDRVTVRRALAALTGALADGAQLTRTELADVLRRARVPPEGERLSHLLGRAELEGLICSGGRRGKQSTFALLEHRAPAAPAALAREEALAELARRYFRSRGPATLDDFQWWSSLPAAEARAAVAAIEPELTREGDGGKTTWMAPGRPARSAAGGAVLLPAFDEYLVGYRDRSAVLLAAQSKRLNAGGGMLNPAVVLDGQVIGTWSRTLGKGRVAVALRLFARPTDRQRQALARAARRYGAFVGMATDLTIS